MKRRFVLKTCTVIAGLCLLSNVMAGAGLELTNQTLSIRITASQRPNVILCMCDDLGWGDVGYNGHPVLKTPHLDSMATQGIRFDRFYSGAPVCSPTRGSCLTGRHPYRYGIFHANTGHMLPEEITLAEVLHAQGYATGHFGKWHLGTLTKTIKDSNRGGTGNTSHYAPPWDNGFDVCFSTEAKVPTWNPMFQPGTSNPYGTRYWRQDGQPVPIDSPEVQGDDSRVIMDQAAEFIRDMAEADRPFLTVIWFHTPHKPVVAGPEYRAMYSDHSEQKQQYYGCVTAMDEQVGRLRRELSELGIAENTMLWFCSDNGPENGTAGVTGPDGTNKFRARKRSLYEGGVRVPGLLVWPAQVKTPHVVTMPCSTSDYFPTVMEALGFAREGSPEPVDGISLVPLIKGAMTERPVPIGFQTPDSQQRALIDNQYKLYRTGTKSYELYDLLSDPYETSDRASKHPQIVVRMQEALELWIDSCARSHAKNDN